MWKRFRFWFVLIAVLGVALAVYFEPTHCESGGWLWGEAFFEGRPTSYWRSVVERDLQVDLEVFLGNVPPPWPQASWLDRCKDWIGFRPMRRFVRGVAG